MLKRFVMLSVLVMVQISAMDVERSKPEDMSSLAPLPVEVLNYLAKFLTFGETESEQEFIARTKAMVPRSLPDDCNLSESKQPNVSNNYSVIIPSDSIFDSLRKYRIPEDSLKTTLVAYSPYETNIALLEVLERTAELVLKIIHHGKQQKVHSETIVKKKYSHLAINSRANMFATIEEVREIDNTPRRTEVMHYIITTKLTIQNIAIKTAQEFVIPGGFRCVSADKHPTIAFNKQGTDLIIHGTDYSKNQLSVNGVEKNPVQHHIIVPIAINTRKVSVTLQDYFEQKGVCKKLILQ